MSNVRSIVVLGGDKAVISWGLGGDVESREGGIADEGVKDKQPQAQTGQHVTSWVVVERKVISHNHP